MGYSEATDALRAFAEATGIPVAETQAGKGSLPYDHRLALGAVGSTGTTAANTLARDADLVIGVGTRYSDFTTASRTAFQDADVRFLNINVAASDAVKHSGTALVADARAALDALTSTLTGWSAPAEHGERAAALAAAWDETVRARLLRWATRRGRPSRRSSAWSTRCPDRVTWWCARPARCPATCTSSGAPATRRATTSSTATPAWATRSPVGSASGWPARTATSTSWSGTAPT